MNHNSVITIVPEVNDEEKIQFPRRICKSKKLSLEAIGLLAFLFSEPSDWQQISFKDVRKRFNLGRRRLRHILKELHKKCGYTYWNDEGFHVIVAVEEPTSETNTNSAL